MPAEPAAAPRVPADLLPVNFRRVGGKVLLTSIFGDHAFVSGAEFTALLGGELERGSPLFERLAERRLLRSALDLPAATERFWTHRAFVEHGPSLHTVTVTLRCDQICAAGAGRCRGAEPRDDDMTEGVAEQTVDLVLRTTSPRATITIGGGEPLLHFPVVKHLVEHALEKNRAFGKSLSFDLVSNLVSLDDVTLDYLVERKVQVTTRIDGLPEVHDRQRALATGSSFAATSQAIARIHERYRSLGLDPALYHVGAMVEVSTAALDEPVALVDTLASLGCRTFSLRPIDAFQVSPEARSTLVPDARTFVAFYRRALDRVIALAATGPDLVERTASAFLARIFGRDGAPSIEVRSPAASGIGSLAYGADGSVYTSDEGRALHALGDDFFRLGDVSGSRYRQLMTHETVRACVLASIREAQPDCASCAYQPFCGTRPERSYAEQGTLFGRMRESAECAAHKGIQDYLFEKLASADPVVRATLERWAESPPRPHYDHASVAS